MMARCGVWSLSTVVIVMVTIQTVCWVVLAISGVIVVVWPDSSAVSLSLVTGLSNLRLSITILGVSFLGILSNIILFTGIRTDIRYLLIPWIVTNIILTLGLFSIGTYLLIVFTFGKRKKDVIIAAISAAPVMFSIFLFIVVISVINLFIKMKQKQLLVRVASSFRGSRASLNYRTRGTPRSVRSLVSCDENNRSGGVRQYNMGVTKTSNSVDNFLKIPEKKHKPQSFHPYSMYKSRSLEYILDSSTDDSLYQDKYTKSLQRLPKRKQSEWKSDTMRSNKSASSGKSVSIYPRVIEYHYNDGKDARFDCDDKKNVMEDVVMSDYSEGSVPPPIFPKQGKMFSQSQMNYCQDFVL